MRSAFEDWRLVVSRVLIWPLFLLLMMTASRWQGRAGIDGALFLLGTVLVGFATIGRLWCSLYICGYKTRFLVTGGPYSMCRNPLYLFSAIGSVGIGLATQTLIVPAVLIVLFALYYPLVIRAEEKRLLSLHGDAYQTYLSTVPRFWPRSLKVSEPQEYPVVPAKFRRAMFDAIWFVLVLGVLKLAESLRASSILPTLLKLY
jgi:protein-S-isoprenylcysteine O-methyltransferase Ste14